MKSCLLSFSSLPGPEGRHEGSANGRRMVAWLSLLRPGALCCAIALKTSYFFRCSVQIRAAVLRNYAKYEAVLLKPWYSSSQQQWTAGEWPRPPLPIPACRYLVVHLEWNILLCILTCMAFFVAPHVCVWWWWIGYGGGGGKRMRGRALPEAHRKGRFGRPCQVLHQLGPTLQLLLSCCCAPCPCCCRGGRPAELDPGPLGLAGWGTSQGGSCRARRCRCHRSSTQGASSEGGIGQWGPLISS